MKEWAIKVVHIVLVLIMVVSNLWDACFMIENPSLYSYETVLEEKIVAIGWLSFFCVVLILFPFTYTTGNLLMVFKIALLILFFLKEEKIGEAFLEIPFLIVSVLLARYGHPFSGRYRWEDMMLERKTTN